MVHTAMELFHWSQAALAVFSALLCLGIVALARYDLRLSGQAHHLQAVQAMHTRPTPRVGGISIFAALAITLMTLPTEAAVVYGKFILACGILFLVGLLEDMGFGISPRRRLVAAAAASLVIMIIFGLWMPRADIPGLDFLLNYWIVGVPFTIFITVGISNGFNLIDGVNGLASLTAIVAAVAMALIARQAGLDILVHLLMMLAAGVLGFFVVNYPFGLIFLGDAGAYTLGFVLAWFGIGILIASPEASAWALLLAVFWPVADTTLAIYRRSQRNADAMAPDRLHFHQLIMRALEILYLGRSRRHVANPLSTVVLAPFIIAPPIAGVIFWDNVLMAFLSMAGFTLFFFASYAAGFALLRRLKRRV